MKSEDLGIEIVSIAGEQIQVSLARRPLDSLRLDPDNPRYRHMRLLGGKTFSEKDMAKVIWEDKATRDLFNSIVASRGINEPVIIRHDGLVREGNRRTVCLRKARKRLERGDKEMVGIPEGAFDLVMCRVLPEKISPVQVDIWLSHIHVSGVKRWKPLNQADHIYRLAENDGLAVDEIARHIGLSRPTVYLRLWAYDKLVGFADKYPKFVLPEHYSFFEELHKVRSKIPMDEPEDEWMFTFFRWIREGKFDQEGAKDVRYLPKVLKDTHTRRVFEEKGMKAARFELSKTDFEVGGNVTLMTVQDAVRALRGIRRRDFEQIIFNPAYESVLKELVHEGRKVLAEIEALRNVRIEGAA